MTSSKKAAVCAMLRYGMSLRRAAVHVRSSHQTILREAKRDETFADEIAWARIEAEMPPGMKVYRAADPNW